MDEYKQYIGTMVLILVVVFAGAATVVDPGTAISVAAGTVGIIVAIDLLLVGFMFARTFFSLQRLKVDPVYRAAVYA